MLTVRIGMVYETRLYRKRKHPERTAGFDLCLTSFRRTGFDRRCDQCRRQDCSFHFRSPISYNTFGVHYEKADINIDGIYSAINQEFASHLPEQYIYLNREEDLGIPGLRQAKLSYHPVLLLEKTKAVKRQAI